MDCLTTSRWSRESLGLLGRNIGKLLAIGVLAATTLAASAASLNSVSCAGNAYTGNGVDNCKVSLNWKTTTGLSVALRSNNSAVGVPSGVRVGAGAASAPFTATIAAVTSAQTATITATANGVSRTFMINLSPVQSSALKLSTSSVNFGNVSVGAVASQPLTVTAIGTVPIYVTSGSISGVGFSVSGATPPATLNPGQSVVLSVQFNPTTAGAATGQITIVSSNAPTVSILLSGSGITAAPGIGALSCSQNTFTGAGTTSCSVSLTNAAPAGGQSVALSSSTGALTVPANIMIPAGASAASFTASATSVSTTQSAAITASANSSAKTIGIQLNAAAPALTVSASSLAFGNVSIGTAISKSITLTSTGTAPVTVSSDAISGAGFSVTGLSTPATLNPGQAAVLSVQFSPTTTASVIGQLTIQSNAPAVSVSLSGAGTSATPTISSVTCSSTSITGALSDLCTVSLTGSAPTGGITVALASSSSSVGVPASISIPATAASATFTAIVNSVSTAQTANLTATTGSSSKTIVLQLNAAASTLTANATSVPFGSVVVNTPTTQTVTLTSTGTAPVTVNSIAVSGSGFSASAVILPASLNPGQSISVTLTFNPQTAGSANGQLTITSNSTTNPTISIALNGTGTPHRVDLSWSAPDGSSDPVVGYNIYRSLHGSNAFGRVNAGANALTAFTDSSVQSATTYDYYVKSVDSAGAESSPSNTATVSIP